MGIAIFISLVCLTIATAYGVVDVLRQTNRIKKNEK
jgi:hypothetical protein